MWDAHTNRNPMLLFRLFGLFLLRLAQRALFRLLFQDPPRTARICHQGAPPAEAGTNHLSQKPRNPIKNFTPKGAARPIAADAANSDQRLRRWGTRTPTETR